MIFSNPERKPIIYKDIVDEMKESRSMPEPAVCEDFDLMQKRFKENNWLSKDFQIDVRTYNEADEQELKAVGSPTDHNLFNVSSAVSPKSVVMMAKNHHNFFTRKESQGIFGHEIAHAIIRENGFINPHNWMFQGQIAGIAGIIVGPLIIARGMAKNSVKTIATGGFATIGGPMMSTYVGQKMHIHRQFGKYAVEYDFPFIRKFVEIECDIISALVHKDGASAIKGALQKWQVYNTEKKITSSPDHPKLSTRIAILNALEKMQKKNRKNQSEE